MKEIILIPALILVAILVDEFIGLSPFWVITPVLILVVILPSVISEMTRPLCVSKIKKWAEDNQLRCEKISYKYFNWGYMLSTSSSQNVYRVVAFEDSTKYEYLFVFGSWWWGPLVKGYELKLLK